jgi:hypothetical protein
LCERFATTIIPSRIVRFASLGASLFFTSQFYQSPVYQHPENQVTGLFQNGTTFERSMSSTSSIKLLSSNEAAEETQPEKSLGMIGD